MEEQGIVPLPPKQYIRVEKMALEKEIPAMPEDARKVIARLDRDTLRCKLEGR
jgi:hypothetical protein